MNQASQTLGTQPVGKLLAQQSVPATIGMMVMSIYMVVDAIAPFGSDQRLFGASK